MDISQLAEIVNLIRDGGSTVLLVTAIVGGAKGWYVWRWQHDAVIAERDQWKAMALRGLSLAESQSR
jgi:hypothetical protein